MSSKGIYVFLIAMFAFACAGIGLFMYFSWQGMRDENAQTRRVLSLLDDQIDMLSKDKQFKQEYYSRLLHDEKFAERIIRDKLGFSDPRDIVFRFNDSKPANVDNNFVNNDEPNPTKVSEDSVKKSSIWLRLMFWRKAKHKPLEIELPISGALAETSTGAAQIKPEFRIDMTGASADTSSGSSGADVFGSGEVSKLSLAPVYAEALTATLGRGELVLIEKPRVEKIRLRYFSSLRASRIAGKEKMVRFSVR